MKRLRPAVNLVTVKMFAFVLLGLLAFASAAPHYHHQRHGAPPPFPRHDDFLHERFFQDDIFDTRSFWDELRRELFSIDAIVEDFVKHFPSSVSTAEIVGDVYRIAIPLPGFEEKEIVVKAKKGLVMVQAVHKQNEMTEKTYMDMRTLPDCVNETGKWTYDNDILKIEFPLNYKPESPTTEVVTHEPHSREDMEPGTDDTPQNADVGVDRGDLGKETEILTNEVPSRHNNIEATTYAVDLKDEVEFIPIRQVK